MKKFTKSSSAFLTLVITLLLAGACSAPKYYVFKTIKHTPVEKTAVEQDQLALQHSAQEAAETEENDALIASTEKKGTEALSLNKISEQMTAKATQTPAPKKISKLEEIKTAIQVKKEVKKLQKELEKQEMSPEASTQGTGEKSQLIALLLAILVGALGIHRFYLGYTAIGIIQLLTLGGCGVWALIDLIRIAMGDLGPADGRPYDETL